VVAEGVVGVDAGPGLEVGCFCGGRGCKGFCDVGEGFCAGVGCVGCVGFGVACCVSCAGFWPVVAGGLGSVGVAVAVPPGSGGESLGCGCSWGEGSLLEKASGGGPLDTPCSEGARCICG